jgi:hypothetical protein
MSPRRRKKSAEEQMSETKLGDTRRTARASAMMAALRERPAASLPKAMQTEAALEAAYRFLSNEEFPTAELFAAHVAETVRRVSEETSVVYAISDTTELRFNGEGREGLGPLQNGGRGFWTHPCLAVRGDGSRMPLGLLALKTWTRAEAPKQRRPIRAARSAPDNEMRKWTEVALAAGAAVGRRASLIHVMDREADIYALFAQMMEAGQRFIVRVAQDRALADGEGLLFPALERAEAQVLREVPLSVRPRASKQHAARRAREAMLSVASCRLMLKRPATADRALPSSLTLSYVHVFEARPPEGEVAVDWKLVTTESVATQAQRESVIDGYRLRWVIEELFKALKTGCAVEQSELESFLALERLLVMKLPLAVEMLALRSQAALNEQVLALGILSPLRLEVLRAMSRTKLSPNPTAHEALLAIARLGGHIKNNGAPGWLVLWRGYEDLLRYEQAWSVARAHE